MASRADARALAESLVRLGTAAGVRTEALVTAMDAPLGRAVGNANEIIESVETLKGRGPADLEELSVQLAARMLVLAGLASGLRDAETRVRTALSSGQGLATLQRIVENQGGDPRVLDDYRRLPSASAEHRVVAPHDGYVTGLRAGSIGRAAVALGAGRARLEDQIDHGVGIDVLAPVGTEVRAGDAVLLLRHRQRGLDAAVPLAAGAVIVSDAPPAPAPLILETIGSHGAPDA